MERRPVMPRGTFVASFAFVTAVAIALSTLTGKADTKATAVCVENTSDEELLFVAEANGGSVSCGPLV